MKGVTILIFPFLQFYSSVVPFNGMLVKCANVIHQKYETRSAAGVSETLLFIWDMNMLE